MAIELREIQAGLFAVGFDFFDSKMWLNCPDYLTKI